MGGGRSADGDLSASRARKDQGGSASVAWTTAQLWIVVPLLHMRAPISSTEGRTRPSPAYSAPRWLTLPGRL